MPDDPFADLSGGPTPEAPVAPTAPTGEAATPHPSGEPAITTAPAPLPAVQPPPAPKAPLPVTAPTSAYDLPAFDVAAYDETPPAGAASLGGASRRRHAHPTVVSPLRALAGSLVAVGGVALVITAVLVASDGPGKGLPSVATSLTSRSPASAPTAGPSATVVTTLRPTGSPIPAPTAPVAVPITSPRSTEIPDSSVFAPLTVLNNSRRPSLADRAAAQYRAGGWPIAKVGNFTGRLVSTTLYYGPGQEAAARHLAAQFVGIKRVLPRFRGLPGSGLTVVLTRDYAA